MRVYWFNEFELDTGLGILLKAGDPVRLEPKQFAVLKYLVEHADRLVTADELLDAIWPGSRVAYSSVRTVVTALRRALGEPRYHKQSLIQVKPLQGYRLLAVVTLGTASTRGLPFVPTGDRTAWRYYAARAPGSAAERAQLADELMHAESQRFGC
jgi:DNA-binding winged helix-turn-helix (wHTH) protein